MDWRIVCAAVIPCLNEERAIGPLVAEVKEFLPTVIVVDDGSIDQTSSVARHAGAVVCQHAKTLGKGRALATGWKTARERGHTWALTMDGDGQHSPKDVPLFFQCVERTRASLVVGNRMDQADRMPMVRRWVNRWMSRQISKLAGQKLPDSQSGFRLMDLENWARLPITAGHFEVESDVLLGFARAGLKIEFVPIQAIYKQEQSKIHPVKDTLRWLRWRKRVGRGGNHGTHGIHGKGKEQQLN